MRKARRVIAAAMAMMLVMTCMPTYRINAEEINQVVAEEVQLEKETAETEESKEATEADTSEKSEAVNIPEETQQEEAETAGEQNVVGEKSELSYLFINKKEIEPGEEQEIVASFDKLSNEEGKIYLVLEDERHQEIKVASEKRTENVVLFKHIFEKGIYMVKEIQILSASGEEKISMEELEICAFFGVGKIYSDEEKSEHMEMETVEDTQKENLQTSIVTIEGDGSANAQSDIASALNAAKRSKARTLSEDRAAEVVVVLDPGHDSKHGGAYGNGVYEHEATLQIAQYCKQELEEYMGVKVLLTRETAACPYPSSKNNIEDIKQRVAWAAENNADIFVSIHLNSYTSSAAKGAEVYYSKTNAEGKNLAQKIQNELAALGLYDRGIQTNEDFTVIKTASTYGFPGIIVEHAYVSNSDDANKYLKTKEGLKKLGIADAKGIAKYFGLGKIGEVTSVSEGTYMIQSALDQTMTVDVEQGGFANSLSMILNKKTDVSSQAFEVKSAGNGYYYLLAEHSGKAIDVRGGSNVSGTKLQQYQLNTKASAQMWQFVNAGNGYYYLKSKLGTYMSVQGEVAAKDAQICSVSYKKSNALLWKLVKPEQRTLKNGTYSIVSSADSKKVMNVAGASIDNRGNIQILTSNNQSEQRFEITYVADGYYKISAEHSAKVLDVSGGSAENGANLQQYTWNGSDAQLWKFIKAENGQYYIRSKKGTAISLASDNTASGTNVNLWTVAGKSSQRWTLLESSYRPVADGDYVITNTGVRFRAATEKNGNIQLEDYDNSENQKFKIQYVDGGYYKITLRKTGKSLDVKSGSTLSGANLQQYTWNGTDAQLFKFIKSGKDSFYIKSKLGTTVELQSGKIQAGTNIRMYTSNGTNAQKWVLDKAKADFTEKPLENGTYTVQNGMNTSMVLDVASSSKKNGANVWLYKSNATPPQRFEFYYVGDGYYKILAEHSGKALDVRSGSTKAGTNLQQYTWTKADAQLWKILDAGDGKYYIKSKKGTVIDLATSKAVSKTNVQMGVLSERDTQKWEIVPSEFKAVQDGTYAVRSASSKNLVLAVENSSMGNLGNAQINTYCAMQAQQFAVSYVKDGYYKITAKHSGKVLEVNASNSETGGDVRQNTWNGSDTQLWKFLKAEKGGYYIKSKMGTALDVQSGKIVAGTNVQTYKINESEAQRWLLRGELEGTAKKIEEGTYIIHTVLNDEQVLDVAKGSVDNGANIQIYKNNDTEAQKFRVEAVSDGYYKIISEKSGKALDVKNGSMDSKTNLQQYTWNGSDAQLWRFIDAGDGKVYIQSKLGNVLDVSGGKSSSGTNVQTYVSNKSSAQKWTLKKYEKLYRIMGKTDTTVAQMAKFYKARAKVSYPYADTEVSTIEDFCKIYIEECNAEGVKAEVAFCQSMLETGFLKFGGDVKPEQYNFAGLGSEAAGISGNSFPDIRTGIRTQVQHLKAYASTEPLKNECVDGRFKYVKRGSAEFVEWLGIPDNPNNVGWATGENYGYNIVKLYIAPLKNTK